MKKNALIFICIFTCSLLFAGGFTDSKEFDSNSVSSLNISLKNENITISTSKENIVYVISETNNKSIFPDVKIVEKELKICSIDDQYDKNNFCNISLIIPESFIADTVTVNIINGELNIKKMTAKTVILTPGPKNSLANIKADYFKIPDPDEADMNIFNLDCKEIEIFLTAGDVNLSFQKLPENNSKISSKYGKLNILIPKENFFTINAISFNSKFINNLNNSVTEWIREGNLYKHNGGGVEISLKTYTGDIVISGF